MNGGDWMAKIEYKKTLQACYPEIAAEWHPTLNGKLTPEDVHNGGSAKVYWLCPNGHTYQKLIAKRTRMGQGCPQCRIEKNAFANVHPELLEYWDYEKNEGINPKTISYGSAKEVWWKCPKGHSYMQTLHSKSAGAGCLICTRQIVSDETSLLAERTDIVAEWHPTKNIGLVDGRGFDISTPDKVTVGSRQKVWWLCPNGHEYPAIIYSRKRSGCPICDSEKRTSFPEQAIQYYLNKLFVAESRFQIGGFEADIYCPSLKVAIEYDGEYFHQGDANDAREERKNEFFIEQGILLFRIKESREKVDFICHDTNYGYLISTTYIQDYYFISDVISSILDKINARFNSDYDIDVNIIRDKVEIISLYAQQKEENSFLMQKPLGAQKWDYEKNGDIDLRLLPRTRSESVV